MTVAAAYLANKPTGAVLIYLVIAIVLFALAAVWAGWGREPYRALMAVGLGVLTLAFLA